MFSGSDLVNWLSSGWVNKDTFAKDQGNIFSRLEKLIFRVETVFIVYVRK